MAETTRFGLLLIAADDYATPPGRLPSSASARRLRDLLVTRGGRATEPIVVTRKDEVWSALGQWARRASESEVSSFVYLVGHGQSDGETHWFILPETRGVPGADNAVRTSTLADLLLTEWQHRQISPSGWVVLVLDCCASDVGVTNLVNELTRSSFRRPRRLGLWPVTPQGASHSGRFVDALARCLETFTENDESIPLRELIRRMGPELGGLEPDGFLPDEAALENPRRAVATVTMTLDAYAELRGVVAALPTEVRSHFLAKAQGAEVGELAWHFCGRETELASLSRWLRDSEHGLRVVTGEAGSGKSALLGHLVVLANEELVNALSRADLLRPPPFTARPPAGTFDAILHLTGKTLMETIREVAAATGAGVASSLEDPVDADAVIVGLAAEPRRLTILCDALDEAQEPKAIASFLRRASAAKRVRVIVGTRRSLDEGPDRPPDPTRRELLDILEADDADLVIVTRDPAATAEYVRRRLLGDGSPYRGRDELVAAIVEQIAVRDQPFLFTRLATAELLARPPFASDDPDLAALLEGGHRAVFAAALARLATEDPTVAVLLHALALARGRGLPETSGVWLEAARAIAPLNVEVPETAVRSALARAAAYITLDGEAGQSTYRLAHQTFVEHFLIGFEPAYHRFVAAALRKLVDRSGGWATANYYIIRYLAEHYVADASRVHPYAVGLTQLAIDTAWLRRGLALLGADRLADALTTANQTVESFAVNAVARAVRSSRVALSEDQDELAAQLHARLKRERDRALMELIKRLDVIAPDTWLRSRTWGLAWRADLDTTLPVVGTVRALAFGALDGHTILAIGIDSRVMLWNPLRGLAEERGFGNNGRRVTALALTQVAGRQTVVVAAGYDRSLSLVDVESGRRQEMSLPAYCDSVAVGTLGGQEVIAAAGNGQAWAWAATTLDPLELPTVDSDEGQRIEGVLSAGGRLALHVARILGRGMVSSVLDLTSGRELSQKHHQEILPPGRASTERHRQILIAARSAERGRVYIWENERSSHQESPSFGEMPLRSLALGTVDDRLVIAAAADYTGTGFISLREASRERRDIAPTFPAGSIHALFTSPNGGVRALMNPPLKVVEMSPSGDILVVGSDDNPSRQIVAQALVGRGALFTFLRPFDDGKQRLLDLQDLGAPHREAGKSYKVRRDRPIEWPATATAYASVGDRAVLAVGSYGGAVWLWDLERQSLFGGPFAKIRSSLTVGDKRKKQAHYSAPVTSVAVWSVAGRDVVATAYDGRVGLWDIASQTSLPSPDTGTTRVAAVALGSLTGRAVLVTGSEDGMLTVWDVSCCERIAGIRLDTRIDSVSVVRGSEIVGVLTGDRMLHLFDVVSRRFSPQAPGL